MIRKAERRALCIGINQYPAGAALGGCVADATAWGEYLSRRGFAVLLLTDRGATRHGMITALVELVETAIPGDVLAFQYSGHGTQVRDLDGDEGDGWDEALVPVDYQSGAFLIDDDLRVIFDRLPRGVTLNCFLDCCYSGTATRLLGINAPRRGPHPDRARYLMLGSAERAAHEAFRATRSEVAVPPARPLLSPEQMNHATVSACMPQEVAWETNGMGDFTRAALAVLDSSGPNLTLNGVLRRTITRLGEDRWQTPMLDGPLDMLRRTMVRKTGA
jgi:hypothetical protein